MPTSDRTSPHLNLEIFAVGLIPAPGNHTVMHTDARYRAPGPKQLEPCLQSRAVPHHLNHNIRPAAISQLPDTRGEPISRLQIIPGLSPDSLGAFEAGGYPIDGQDGLGRVLQRSDQRAEAHGPAPDDHDHALAQLSRRQRAERVGGREVAGGQDVGHEAELGLVDAGGRPHGRRVGEGHAHVLGLPAVEGRAPEEQGLRAARREAARAVEARAAAHGEGAHDGVAGPQGRDAGADLVHGSRELVAHDKAGGGCLVASVYMQLAAK